MQMHGFAVASVRAYGDCIYLLGTVEFYTYTVKLIHTKSKVAPLKVPLSRIELCVTLSLTRLAHRIMTKLNLEINRNFFVDRL